MIRWTPTTFDRVFDEFFSNAATRSAASMPMNDTLTISAQHQHEQEHGEPHGNGCD